MQLLVDTQNEPRGKAAACCLPMDSRNFALYMAEDYFLMSLLVKVFPSPVT